MRARSIYALWLVLLGNLVPTASPAAPGDTLFYNSLNGNLNAFTVVASGGNARIANNAANQGRSLELRWGPVSVYTDPISAAVPGAELTLWIRRGADSFSENPEAGEDLVIEYRDGAGTWIEIDRYDGGGTPGQIYTPTYVLPAGALHGNSSIQVRLAAGSGSDNDYWHIDDIRVTETVAPGVNEPVLFSFDETSWTGAPGEVLDSGSAGLAGTVFGGASNDDGTPALAGNPGTCRYGEFDGVDDYVEIADGPALDIAGALTVAAWINMGSYPGELHTIASKDTNYEFHVNASGQVYWWWNDSGGTVRSLTTAGSLNLNQWYHVAVVYASGVQTIYVNGSVWATASYAGTLAQNDVPFYVGTDWNFISRAFDGFIDEVSIASRAYSQAEVQALRDATHPCPTAAAEFSINHDGFGIHCMAETIAVDVIDSIAGTPLTSYNASIELDTQTGNGTWVLVSGGGTLTDATADDGLAVYDWPLNESQALFALSYTQGTPIFDIDVYQISDTGIRDTDSEGTIEFSASGFTLTAAPLSNPPPGVIVPFSQAQTAAVWFDLHIAAYGQTPNDPVCGVVESYDGVKSLQFWSTYLNPASGTIAVTLDTGIDAGPIAGAEAAALAQSVAFTAGRATVGVGYKDVGSLQIAVKDETTVNAELPQGIRGATAGFVSRPASFELTNIANGAGTIPNPAAADAFGDVFIGAGTAFRATVTSLDADGDATPNYGRESVPEGVGLAVNLVAPAGGASPGIASAVGFGAFSAGTATGTDFYWPEVGIIRLVPSVADGDYLGAGNVVGAETVDIGRFVPDHFALGYNAPFLQTQCASGSFTYAGQPFGYAIAPVITATARAATNALTANYTGDFFKIRTADLANRSYTSASGLLDSSGVPSAAADPTVTETAPGVATLVFSSGSGLSFDRTSMPSPFGADIVLSVEIYDEDTVAASSNPATFGASGGISFTDGAEIRYGRLRFTNAVGSELVDLPVPLRAEHFAGAGIGFVANVADSCTTNVALTLAAFSENLGAGETCILDSGSPGASGAGCPTAAPLPRQFAEPPLAGDFNLTLAAPGGNNHGSVRIDSVVPSWLRFDWDAGVAGDESPSGHATFGLYDGDPAQIYLRELYY